VPLPYTVSNLTPELEKLSTFPRRTVPLEVTSSEKANVDKRNVLRNKKNQIGLLILGMLPILCINLFYCYYFNKITSCQDNSLLSKYLFPWRMRSLLLSIAYDLSASLSLLDIRANLPQKGFHLLFLCDAFSLLSASSNTIQSLKSFSRLFIFLTLRPILLKVTVNLLLLLRCHHEEKNQANLYLFRSARG
jgi:hypothetical protein